MERIIEKCTPEQLWDWKDRLDLQQARIRYWRGEGANYTRHHCKTMRKRINAELRRRKQPTRRPGDTRTYGPGQAAWQGAKTNAH